MFDPYRMIVVNITLSLLLLCGVIVYNLLYPKKKLYLPFIFLPTSVLPIISIMRKGIYESGDFTIHIYRAMVFYESLKEGILVPSWAGELNGGFGYPVFNFIYIFPYYLISFFHFFGFSFIDSLKIVLALSFVLSGIIMYILLKKMFKQDISAFFGSIVYLYTPYHLVDLHFRVAVGEIIAFALSPLVFLLIQKIKSKPTILSTLWLGVVIAIFFLTHPAIFIFFSGISILYIFFLFKFEKTGLIFLISIFTSFILGLTISSFAWVARFTLTQYTDGTMLLNNPVSFTNPIEFLYSPWRYGFLFQGPNGELSYLLGYTQIVIFLLAIVAYKKKKNNNNFQQRFHFWILLTFSIVLLMFPLTKPIWNFIPLLNLMQFNNRLLHSWTFCISILAAFVGVTFERKRVFIFSLITITILYTILNWGHRRVIPSIQDDALRKNIQNSTREGEGMIEGNTIWWNSKKDFWIRENKTANIEILSGKGSIVEYKRTSIDHLYIIEAKTKLLLLENTFYFPGWTITDNKENVVPQYTKSDYPARMVFEIPQGLHFVQVKFSDIPPISIAKKIGIYTVTFILLYTLYSFFKRERTSKTSLAKQKKFSVSLIIPVFNNESSVVEQVQRCKKILRKYCKDYEIILSDDHSTDNTPTILKKNFGKKKHFRLLLNKKNKGITQNTRQLYDVAKKDYILFFSADGDWSPDDIDKLLKTKIKYNADLVVGKRVKKDGYTFYRNIISWGHRFLPFLLFGVDTIDPGSLKIVKIEFYNNSIISKSQIFEAEMLIRASKKGYKIYTCPVTYIKPIGSVSSGGSISSTLYSILEVFRLRLKYTK